MSNVRRGDAGYFTMKRNRDPFRMFKINRYITVRNNDGNFWSMLSGLAEICDFCKLCEAVTFFTGIRDPSCYIFLKSSRRDLFKNMYFCGEPTIL